MGKKKWEKIEERQTEVAKSEQLFEDGLRENGFNILGYRWYYEKSEYNIEKDDITLIAVHYRTKASKKVVDDQIKWVIDCFEMKKKLEVNHASI